MVMGGAAVSGGGTGRPVTTVADEIIDKNWPYGFGEKFQNCVTQQSENTIIALPPHVNVEIIRVFGVPLSGRSSKRTREFDDAVMISRDRITVNMITDTVGNALGVRLGKFRFPSFSSRAFRTLFGRAVVPRVVGPHSFVPLSLFADRVRLLPLDGNAPIQNHVGFHSQWLVCNNYWHRRCRIFDKRVL